LPAYLREHNGIAMRRSRTDEILLVEGLRRRRPEACLANAQSQSSPV
jgi:hypothetical protein